MAAGEAVGEVEGARRAANLIYDDGVKGKTEAQTGASAVIGR